MKEKEMLGGCCVCSDERGWPDNPLVYCDGNGCSVAVHQACYGIVTVPTGPWYCRKCESPDIKGRVRCELCPSKSGALKRSDTGGWAHVVCALYIPEVRFGNVTSMEPIVLRLIPPERYNKVCYICQDLGKTHRATAGACMQCNKTGCKQQFHVTCAQSLGLLCEEAGNYLDNVKYCGYCQHHYSKLKKGGNVKTIPPYKPVMHDSHSSDSSGEKDGETSPLASESGTPTHSGKSKGPGRKSSHSSNSNMGKNTPNSSKTSTSSSHTLVKLHHGSEKGKKPSPSRRGSSTGELAQFAGSGSKSNTPAPSPQHGASTSETNIQPQSKTPGNSTPKTTPPRASPSHAPKSQEAMSVISSISSATYTTTSTPNSSANTTSVVQTPNLAKPLTSYQESVITNAESMENKHTKKRKAINAANAALEYPAPPATPVSDLSYQPGMNTWDNNNTNNDVPMETMEKIIKKAKTEPSENPLIPNYQNIPLPPPPLPIYSPSSQRSPRLHANTNPLPGPSGVNNPSSIRSPSQPPGGKGLGIDRDSTTSLLVSVPLPSTSQGLNLSAHAQLSGASNENTGLSPHIFHQMSKLTAAEQSAPGHPGHAVPSRSTWGGLSVAYDAQQLECKPGYSAVPSTSKEPVPSTSGVGGNSSRSKKRSPMGPSVVGMPNANPPAIQTTTPYAPQRQAPPPQPTPPPVYHETIKDSPPTSPGMERPHKGKMDNKLGPNCSAPHMLGNELNPESGAAARLQQQLSAELAAHAQGGTGPTPLVPPPLINKATHGPSSSSSKSSSCGAQSLDQLLERQWEQGSQFLMEQAQHFDIASLLSCLHQLRTENVRLEEHVSNLLQRRDHLLAVNARLAIPLTAVTPGPSEPSRCPRDAGPQVRGPPVPVRSDTMPTERHQLMMREVQQKPS